MKTSFFKRQRTWIIILLAGLIIIIGSMYWSGYRFKAENYLPLASNKTDTTALVLTGFNFGFETVSNPNGLPDGWELWGSYYASYSYIVDSLVKHSGNYSLRIEPNANDTAKNVFGCPHLAIPVEFAGKTATVKAFMKFEDAENPIGLLLRIDGDSSKMLAFDNMQQRGIKGTQDWTEYSVTVDLPQNAKTIHIGAILSGKGKLWIDDFQVSIGNKKVVEQDFNFGFETVSYSAEMPDGWGKWGYPSYNIQIDSVVKHSGKYALRVEPKDEPAANEFGCPTCVIPAIYEGKNITVKAFMKFEDVTIPIGLMLRIDSASNKMAAFDNMMQKGIKGTQNWMEYSVTLPLSEKAKTIYIGAILADKGKLWIDDFQVLIDGEDISKAKLKPE